MKKIFITLLIIVLLLPVISTTIQLVGDSKVKITHNHTETLTVSPGDVVDYQIEVKSNWINPISDKIELPSLTGVQAITQPVTTLKTGNFTTGTWILNFSLVAYDLPDKEAFRITIPFKDFVGKRQKTEELLLPLFKLKTDFESDGKLALSDKVDKLTEEEAKLPIMLFIAIMAIIFIVVTLFIVLIIGLLNRKSEAKKIVIPPWITANQKMESIKDRLPMNGEQFFVELSDLLRVYIENLYKLHATESTTKEFLQEMQRSSLLTKETKLSLGSFLIEADMIKFAKQEATEEQMNKSLATTETFVKTSSEAFINEEKDNA